MTYEEKYKQALKVAKKELQACGDLDCDAARQIFRLFPELKEDEDERIRKELIEFVKSRGGFKQEYITWLEKQKEPKYIDTSDCEPWSDEQTRRNLVNFLKSLGATEIPQASRNRYLSWLEKHGEHKPVEWSEEDELMLSRFSNCIGHYYADNFITKEQQTLMEDWLKSLKERMKGE